MIEHAPGGPGIAPTWTSSAKDMVGCALGISRLWFTLGFGIVNEVYYPRVDIPQIRDLGFIIADGEGFWAEVKRVANYRIRLLAPGVPAVEVVHEHKRYSLRLRIAPSMCWRSNVGSMVIRSCGLTSCLRRISAPLATATALPSFCIAVAGLCGPSRGRSAPHWLRLTKGSAMLSAGPAPAMSATATAGRILPAMAR